MYELYGPNQVASDNSPVQALAWVTIVKPCMYSKAAEQNLQDFASCQLGVSGNCSVLAPAFVIHPGTKWPEGSQVMRGSSERFQVAPDNDHSNYSHDQEDDFVHICSGH